MRLDLRIAEQKQPKPENIKPKQIILIESMG